MTRIERVRAALEHRPGEGIPSYVRMDGEVMAKYRSELRRRYVPDPLYKQYTSGVLSEKCTFLYGMGSHIVPISCPWWQWYDVTDDFQDYSIPEKAPKVWGRGSYSAFADGIKAVKDHTDMYVLVMIWCSHFEKACDLRGIENFLADMAAEPEYAQELLNSIINRNMVMLENIVHTEGIDGILLGSDWGSQKDMLMSPEVWREMIRGGEQKEYDLIHDAGLDVWVHSCGNIQRILPDLVEMGIDALNPIQPECMNLEEIQNGFGKDLTFWGGISTQNTLPFGTPAYVCEETKRITKLMSQSNGYIIGPSQDIQLDVPLENICALLDTAKEFSGEV